MRRLTVLALAATLAACAGGPTPDADGVLRADVEFRQVALTEAPATAAVVAASDEFGLATLRAADPAENLVFSPASAVVALTMLGEGATNAGAAELDGLLGAGGDDRSVAVNALVGVLRPFDGDPGSVNDEDLPERPLLHVANNVVLDDQADVEAAFLKRLAEYHDAGVQTADLASSAGKDVLDAWVRQHTGGRIEESAMVPSDDLWLVLQDAVLLAARWQQEFDPEATTEASFTAAGGVTQTADFMNTLQPLRYASHAGWQAVELPYREDFAVARVILPPRGVDPAEVDSGVLAALEDSLGGDSTARVMLSLPRFTIDSSTELRDILESVGVRAIFDPAAQALEGISPGNDLHVGQAVQQATITVGEQGTVAAAVTEIGVAGTAAPQIDVVMVVDRPFLVVIEETTTGWDLFHALVRSVE